MSQLGFKKVFLILFLLLVLSSFSSAVTPNNAVAYWDFEEGSGTNIIDQWGVYNLTQFGTANYNSSVPSFNTTGDGGSYSTYQINNGGRAYTNGKQIFDGYTEFTISFWLYRVTDTGGFERIYAQADSANDWNTYMGIFNTDDKLFWAYRDSTSTVAGNFKSTQTINTGQWYNIVLIHNSTNDLLYIDGILDTNQSLTVDSLKVTGSSPFVIHSYKSDVNGEGNLKFDDWKIFNTTINQANVSSIFNTGNLTPPVVGNTTYFDLTAKNVNNDFLTNFSTDIFIGSLAFNDYFSDLDQGDFVYYTYTNLNYLSDANNVFIIGDDSLYYSVPSDCVGGYISNSLWLGVYDDNSHIICRNATSIKTISNAGNFTTIIFNYNLSTTNGTINTNINQSLSLIVDINISSNESGGYFNKSFSAVNTSSDYVATGLFQSVVRVYAEEVYNNNSLSNFNVTDDLGVEEVASTYAEFETIAGTRTYSVNKEDYFVQSQSFSVPALSNYSSFVVSNVSNYKLNFTAVDLASSSSVNNFTIVLNASNGVSQSVSTTNGFISFNITSNLSYEVYIDAEGYAFAYQNFSGLTPLNSSEYEFGLYTTNSVAFSFYDIDTLDFLNGTNISVELIGLSAQILNTSNGTLYVDLLSPDAYTISYSAANYNTGRYFLRVFNRSNQNLTLYLTKSNTTTLVLLSVFDSFGTPITDGAEITIQRYEDGWKTDQILVTDFNAQAEGYYVLSNVYYNHVIEYKGTTYFGVINNDSNKKLIFAEDVTNGLKFYLDLAGSDVLSDYQTSYFYTHNLSFNRTSNSTGKFRFYFSSSDNAQVTGCLKIYDNSMILVNSSCTTSSNGIINLYLNSNSSKLYHAFGSIEGVVVDSLTGRVGVDVRDNIFWGTFGFAIAFFLVVIAFFLFYDNPSMSVLVGGAVFCGLMIVGLIFSSLNSSVKIIFGVLTLAVLVALIKSNSGVNA